MSHSRWELDRVRLLVQAVIAAIVLGGATYLAAAKIIDSGAIIALYGAALGAVGGGAVGGTRTPQERITQHYSNGGTLTTERPVHPPDEKGSP